MIGGRPPGADDPPHAGDGDDQRHEHRQRQLLPAEGSEARPGGGDDGVADGHGRQERPQRHAGASGGECRSLGQERQRTGEDDEHRPEALLPPGDR